MAGIYIHIPFCKQRCSYCDFYSSTENRMMDTYTTALCNELAKRKDYLNNEPVETVYWGGGTPSALQFNDFAKIFVTLVYIFGADSKREVTLEVNPDDITPDFLSTVIYFDFNRISLGVQSFNNLELKLLNRRHDAQSAIRAVELLQMRGFDNISIDLMYGLPGQSLQSWEETLRQALTLDVQHISAYHLTYEEGTPLYGQLKKNSITPVDEEMSNRMFEILIDMLTAAGFEHYEISNFARRGFQSQHNTSYWNGTYYLGIGASAHSYNGFSRRWNRKTLMPNYWSSGFEVEVLDEKMKYNDFIITRLRMMKGINLKELTLLFNESGKTYCLQQAQKYIANGLLQCKGNYLRLTRKGIFISDSIMSDLMR